MNNNEETRILNPETKNVVDDSNANNTEVKSKENGEWGKRAASVASAFVGGAAGAAAAEIADNYINNTDEEVVVEEVETDATTATTSSSNPQQVVPEEEIVATPEDPESIPSDARLVSTEEPIENVQPASYNGEDEDGEVRVVGVQAVQNEDGSQAIVAGLELDGDQAMVVDVNSDGTINLFIHDDNGDGQISDDEVHDITADNISTQAIIDDAMAEQANQDLYYASDDTPDYMNDADTGYIEV